MDFTESNRNWTIQSSTKGLNVYLAVAGAVGLILIKLTYSLAGSEPYGYWAGLFLVALALFGYLFIEDTTVTVDEVGRKLFFQRKSRVGRRAYAISFDDVESVGVASVGQSRRGIVTHHLILRLKNGKTEAPGKISPIQADVAGDAQKLASAIGCECVIARKYNAMNFGMFAKSAIGAILIYALWYRMTTGQVCMAMWFGTAPPIIMTASFFVLFKIQRRVP